ncbi:MAG: patatin-like phospholipase family protein [Thermoanaerobaculia bacterium]
MRGRRALALAALLVAACASSPPPSPPAPPTPTPAPTPRAVRPKVGLALGGGGARGFAEIGVLRVLEQEKIPIDVVIGTSVGSLVGALYADTGRVLDAEFHAITVNDEDLFDYSSFAFFSGGFVRGEKLRKFLGTHLKNARIENMAVPFGAVAVVLRTGQAVLFERGPVAPAIHASCAIPGVFVPVEIGGVTYVDGGVTEPIPVSFARQKGADVVVAVAIPAAVPAVAPRNSIEVAFHAAALMAAELGRIQAREADVVIAPEVGDIAYDDFTQKKRLIEAGEAATRRALPALRAALDAKTRYVNGP